jgi:CDP-glycerol glycerophosphotransferase (TagB/SpsB family)
MRAGVTISCGMTPLNLLNFVSKNAIKISLNHGCGPRSTSGIDTSVFKDVNQLLERVHKFDYFNFTSDFTCQETGQKQYKLSKDKIIKYGFPRCDHLFDKKNIEYSANKKEILKENAKIKDMNTKCILYSPTWRPTQLKLPTNSPIELIENFNLIDFDRWLKDENINLFISKHPRDNNALNLNECSQINYLNQHHLFDINKLLPEIDILITDYSSIATDFMIMDRPVLYIMPDYDAYLRSYGLLEDILLELPGYNVSSLEELKKYILGSILDPLDMSHMRNKYIKKYYDRDLQNSSSEVSKFIDFLIKK